MIWGWKELKAYQFRCGPSKHGRAYLETSEKFLPRIRQAALAMRAGRAPHVFWVADAADWIKKGLAVQWPDAVQIVDLWHAWQHIHDASRKIFGEGTPQASAWAKRYCQELREYGGWTVWNSYRQNEQGIAGNGCDTRPRPDRKPWMPCWDIFNATPTGWTIQPTNELAGPSAADPWRASASNWACVSRVPACGGARPTSLRWPLW